MTVYLCEPDLDGILCAVYDALMSREGHENVRIELSGGFRELELFPRYVQAPSSPEKARKVIRSIRQRAGSQVYEEVYIASLSPD